MRILLTGASGMVGRNFMGHAFAKEHEVLSPTRRDLDLCDYAAVIDWIRKHRPSIVVHAAGKVGGIQANMREPVSFFVDNLKIGMNVVMAARNNNIENLINLGSSCMYPPNVSIPSSEDMILQGGLEPTNEGYALAKIAVARLCSYIYAEDNKYQYKTLVPCNIYGRHDKFSPEHSHMVPALIRKVHDAKKNNQLILDIWGDGTARREFMYAGDLVDCMWNAVINFDSVPKIMNVGLGYDLSVNQY